MTGIKGYFMKLTKAAFMKNPGLRTFKILSRTGWILVLVGYLFSLNSPGPMGNPGSPGLFRIGLLFVAAAHAVWLNALYRIWKVVDNRAAARRAVALLFVPVFNIYWVFRAVPGLAKKVNLALATKGHAGVSMRSALSLAYCLGFIYIIYYFGDLIAVKDPECQLMPIAFHYYLLSALSLALLVPAKKLIEQWDQAAGDLSSPADGPCPPQKTMKEPPSALRGGVVRTIWETGAFFIAYFIFPVLLATVWMSAPLNTSPSFRFRKWRSELQMDLQSADTAVEAYFSVHPEIESIETQGYMKQCAAAVPSKLVTVVRVNLMREKNNALSGEIVMKHRCLRDSLPGYGAGEGRVLFRDEAPAVIDVPGPFPTRKNGTSSIQQTKQ